jgi:hypothetical protein
MSQARNLSALGLPGVLAQSLGGLTANTLTAAGSTQATALALPADINFVTTAAAGTGVILPASSSGDSFVVRNGGANACLIYPPVGGTINALAANAGYSVAAGSTGLVWFVNATTLIAMSAA